MVFDQGQITVEDGIVTQGRDLDVCCLTDERPAVPVDLGEDLLQEDVADKRTSAMVGRTFRALCESVNKNGLIEGRTQGNIIIEFPADEKCWDIQDQYMFGPDYLVAPVLHLNEFERDVYLPAGTWKDADSGEILEGGRNIRASAPIDRIPVFERV